MENKYYQPTIKDLYIGYECEWQVDPSLEDKSEYKSEIITRKGLEMYMTGKAGVQYLRVPYLTKEQIEKEGFESICISPKHLVANWYKKGLIRLKYFPMTSYNIDGYLEIHSVGADEFDFPTLYNGTCKCINEFRTICKLLNIK